jgi:hypothetical protein
MFCESLGESQGQLSGLHPEGDLVNPTRNDHLLLQYSTRQNVVRSMTTEGCAQFSPLSSSSCQKPDISLDSFKISVIPPKNTDPKFVIFDIVETEKIFGWKPEGDIFKAIAACVNTVKSSNQQLRQHH